MKELFEDVIMLIIAYALMLLFTGCLRPEHFGR